MKLYMFSVVDAFFITDGFFFIFLSRFCYRKSLLVSLLNGSRLII